MLRKYILIPSRDNPSTCSPDALTDLAFDLMVEVKKKRIHVGYVLGVFCPEPFLRKPTPSVACGSFYSADILDFMDELLTLPASMLSTFSDSFFVQELTILPQYRNRNIASEFLSEFHHLFQQASGMTISRIFLTPFPVEVNPDHVKELNFMYKRLVRFYLRNGFSYANPLIGHPSEVLLSDRTPEKEWAPLLLTRACAIQDDFSRKTTLQNAAVHS